MSEGQRFLDKCLEATVAVDPWPHECRPNARAISVPSFTQRAAPG